MAGWLIDLILLGYAVGFLLCLPRGRYLLGWWGASLRRAYDRAKERRAQLAPTGAEPDTLPAEVPTDVPWQTYAQHAKELGVPVQPVKKLPTTDELVQLRGKAVAEFGAIYADGHPLTSAHVDWLNNLTAMIWALEDAIRVSETIPPDRSWITTEDIGRPWAKPRVPRRCLICGAEIRPWTGRDPKPQWRIAGYCSKNCSDLMVKSESVVAQLDAIERRIADTSRRIADTSKRLHVTERRQGVWLEAGETIRPLRPPWLTPNEEAARLHKATKQVCSYCNRYAVGGVCQRCVMVVEERSRQLKAEKHHDPM